ncbi:MAG: thiamine diphosphokinase [Ignavibacteriae bacterium]|nr:thiamine diphosphokinase [Ignavibacteriota bacterium]MCB9215087.1 thiamine diphosphokinase [Ignavibacteria bacterium]
MITPSAYEGGPLLILDGDLPSEKILQQLISQHSLLIAADGAAGKLQYYNIRPDLIIGDFDSLGDIRFDPFFGGTELIEDKSQQAYDGEKCLAWVVNAGHDRVMVVGVGGGMIDHVLNNFSLLAKFADRLSISTRQEDSIGYVVTSTLSIATNPEERISLIPLPSALLYTEGLEWNLEGEELSLGRREGASNRALGSEVRVDVAEQTPPGCIILFHYPQV